LAAGAPTGPGTCGIAAGFGWTGAGAGGDVGGDAEGSSDATCGDGVGFSCAG
jgi:hypothetical protein